ncbi:pyridoxal-dependent decarboxylase domain-containing protein 1-like [Dendronephthya gigantea]|uniref:pyridoxal-dependent decarboxylase domain-containing protein 1-like n=1 Tax=Dendronephthya gigantea TaxID=151771 RepID=UPI00106C6A79|nr:pyridoxal-dependent decarboxylase domain-containing protein 1-like [Dendronephthya gigantea]
MADQVKIEELAEQIENKVELEEPQEPSPGEAEEIPPQKETLSVIHEIIASLLNVKSQRDDLQPATVDDCEKELQEVLQEISSQITEKGVQNRYYCHPTRNTHVSILARTFTSYLSLLEQTRLDQLYAHLVEEVTEWISKLFNFDNSLAYFHHHCWTGIVKVCRLALRMKYPKYATDGFTALYTRPPVIYISAASHPSFGAYLRMELGLPQSSICEVPCNTMFGSLHSMDIAAFERLLSDDISCGKTPLLVVANAGTPLVGHTDNLQRLRELSTQNGLWLHVIGDTLATLSLASVPSSMTAAISSDSMTLMLHRWFAMPTAHCCTLYRIKDPVQAAQSGLGCTEQDVEMLILPLWICMKKIGIDELRNSVVKAGELAQHMCHLLDLLPNIKRIEQSRCISPVVVFRYSGESSESESSEGSNSSEEGDDESSGEKNVSTKRKPEQEKASNALIDSFNKMLVSSLAKDAVHVSIDLIRVPSVGWCLRFNPLVFAATSATTNESVDHFIKCLETKISAFDATLADRVGLFNAVADKPHAVLVDIPDFPGVGAVQFIPQYWKSKDLKDLPAVKQQELDELNTDVLAKLSDKDLFSQGETADGRVCIKIGLVNRTVNVQEIVELLEKSVKEVQESAKFMEKMADVIRKGIEAAEHDLVQDSNDILMEEGLLRQVPLVSSLYNWFSPLQHEKKIKGRTFDLSSGSLQTTEKTYKYHMQVQEGEEATG